MLYQGLLLAGEKIVMSLLKSLFKPSPENPKKEEEKQSED
jgi:hypothetical protein